MVHKGAKRIRNGAKKFALGGPAGGRQDNQSSAHLFAIDWTICLPNGPAASSGAILELLFMVLILVLVLVLVMLLVLVPLLVWYWYRY